MRLAREPGDFGCVLVGIRSHNLLAAMRWRPAGIERKLSSVGFGGAKASGLLRNAGDEIHITVCPLVPDKGESGRTRGQAIMG